MSLSGAVLSSYKRDAETVDTGNLPSGTYFLKVSSASGNKVYKFVRE
jgi:hypothetical protein